MPASPETDSPSVQHLGQRKRLQNEKVTQQWKELPDDKPGGNEILTSSRCVTAQPDQQKSFLQRMREILVKYMKFVGPGLMISVAYMDPGNYATDVSAGASHQFALLCIVLYSGLIAIFLQSLCIKLGTVTGLDLSRACREFFPWWLNIAVYILSEAAIIATDIAEVIGGAIALNILLKIPLPAGAVITCTDVLLVLLAYTPGTSSMRLVRIFELGVATLVLAVTVCLCLDLAYIPSSTSVAKIFRGFIPSREIFHNNGMYAAVGILGATVMPHSLFLGSGIVQPRLLEYDVEHGHYSMRIDSDDESSLENKTIQQTKESRFLDYRPSIYAIRYAMKYSIIEVSVALLTFALFINCAILIVSGSALYGTPEAIDADLYTIHRLLSDTLAPAAGTIFMLALLFSGQSAGIVCTIAGQIVCEGHIRWTITPWKRRILTRAIALIPTLAVSTALGKNGLSQALNASQVALSILLPFLTAPLIYFTCSKRIMRVKVTKPMPDSVSADEEEQTPEYVDMSNGWITALAAILIWIFISFLNIYAIVQLGISGQA
ncbi:AaceriADL159Cp [[Ashbya] aceris (nom. inval.)]|nr:AaceriADL159Cp [[Ashbya] aceris (nom. inval.)]